MDLSQSIQILELKKNEIVFEFGSFGELFYIILSGEVAVFIPDKESGEQHRKRSVFAVTQLMQDLDEQIKFIEITRIGAGKSFGELALESGGTRSARIVCSQDSVFATINKESYQKVLSKIEKQEKEGFIEFIRQIPFISHWSKNLLGKLKYSMDVMEYHRGQKIITEGEPSTYIYIVKTGEYELVKNMENRDKEIKNKNGEEDVIRRLLNHEDSKRCQALRMIKDWHDPSRVKRSIRLSILGECKLIGANDARFNLNATATVVATSLNGVLYRIKASEFLKHLKNDEETWLKFTQNCVLKEK